MNSLYYICTSLINETMKTKKYLHIIVTPHEGKPFDNPLMLSEVHLISKMAQENKKLEVKVVETSEGDYKSIFGR